MLFITNFITDFRLLWLFVRLKKNSHISGIKLKYSGNLLTFYQLLLPKHC